MRLRAGSDTPDDTADDVADDTADLGRWLGAGLADALESPVDAERLLFGAREGSVRHRERRAVVLAVLGALCAGFVPIGLVFWVALSGGVPPPDGAVTHLVPGQGQEFSSTPQPSRAAATDAVPPSSGMTPTTADRGTGP